MIRKILIAVILICLLASSLEDRGPVAPSIPITAPPAAIAVVQNLPDGHKEEASLPRDQSALQEVPRVRLSTRASMALVKIVELERAVRKYAKQHGVDEDLVWAVMRHESGFNPQAVSPKGAMGLMQLMPETASLLGVTDPFDVEQNIAAGIKYLELCLSRFNQDTALALAAYNAGPQNVAKYQGCPPFPETRQYVAAVLQTYSGQPQYRRLPTGSSVKEQVAALLEKVGLHWRVPAPQWKLAEPQVHVRPPRWKGARENLATMAR